MKRLAILTFIALSMVVPAAFAQDTTTTNQTTTGTTATGDQTTTTTRTQTHVDHDNDAMDWNHGSIGIFADYLRLEAAGTNNFGLGGRFGFAVHPNIHLEGEIAYDFEESHTATIGSGLTTPSATYKARFRILHGLFGPKIQTTGPVRVFGVLKGGFVNFSVSTLGAPAGFTNSFGNVVDGDTHAVFYPGGGVELGAKWFAIRGEVGDEIYFADGAHNNFRLTVGPVFRF
jgi:hypothetical protein